MYIRFVVAQRSRETNRAQGLFRAAGELQEAEHLSTEEDEQIESLIAWFEENLHAPDLPNAEWRFVFWYRESAHECIRRMWELANVLHSHGYDIEVQTCARLANIRYSDKLQVAARPSRHDAPIIRK